MPKRSPIGAICCGWVVCSMQEGKEVEMPSLDRPVFIGGTYLPYAMRCVVSVASFDDQSSSQGVFSAKELAKKSASMAVFLDYAERMAEICGLRHSETHEPSIIWLPTDLRFKMTPAVIFRCDREKTDMAGRLTDGSYIVSQHNVLWHGAFSAGYSAEPDYNNWMLSNELKLYMCNVMEQKKPMRHY